VKRAAFLDREGFTNRNPPEGQYATRGLLDHLLSSFSYSRSVPRQSGFSLGLRRREPGTHSNGARSLEGNAILSAGAGCSEHDSC
jgi:hypothetical protein